MSFLNKSLSMASLANGGSAHRDIRQEVKKRIGRFNKLVVVNGIYDTGTRCALQMFLGFIAKNQGPLEREMGKEELARVAGNLLSATHNRKYERYKATWNNPPRLYDCERKRLATLLQAWIEAVPDVECPRRILVGAGIVDGHRWMEEQQHRIRTKMAECVPT